MEIHIGKKIKKHLEKLGMTKAEFSRRINRSPQNVYDIFDRESLDSKLLFKIGEILNYNFFLFYSEDTEALKEPEVKYIAEAERVRLEKKILKLQQQLENNTGKIEHLTKENQYLKEINQLLKEKQEKNK